MRSGAFEGRFATRIAQEMRRMSGRALSSRHSRNDFKVCDPTSALRLVVAQWLELHPISPLGHSGNRPKAPAELHQFELPCEGRYLLETEASRI